jgi:hypothetical protein
MKTSRSVGVALSIVGAMLSQAGFTQTLGQECPLSQKGRPCADDSTCMEASCSGPEGTTTRAYCESLGNVCGPDKKYMDPCGTNGRCTAQTVEFGGLEPDGKMNWCRIGAYVCSELPPFVDWDASPDARAAQLRRACPSCPPFGSGGPAPDAGVAPGIENEGARTSSSDEKSSCTMAATRKVGSAGQGPAALLAVAACRVLRRLRRRTR